MQAPPDKRPTQAIAAEQTGAYVQPLWPGALAMPIEIRDEDEGTRYNLISHFFDEDSLKK